MADYTQKLQATISAVVEWWQTGFNSLIVQHVQFFSWAEWCSTRCDLFNLVPRCPVSQCPPLRYGGALSGLAIRLILIYRPRQSHNFRRRSTTRQIPCVKNRAVKICDWRTTNTVWFA